MSCHAIYFLNSAIVAYAEAIAVCIAFYNFYHRFHLEKNLIGNGGRNRTADLYAFACALP